MTTKFPKLVLFEFHRASNEAAAEVDAALNRELIRVDWEDSRPSEARNAVEVVTSG